MDKNCGHMVSMSKHAKYKKHEDHARENIVRSLSASDQNIMKPWCHRETIFSHHGIIYELTHFVSHKNSKNIGKLHMHQRVQYFCKRILLKDYHERKQYPIIFCQLKQK